MTKIVGTRAPNDRIIIMSIKYSEYLDAVAIKYRTLSYNDLAPKTVTGALPRIDVSFAQVIELLGPYCGVRVLVCGAVGLVAVGAGASTGVRNQSGVP